jgi:hypothetical protein
LREVSVVLFFAISDWLKVFGSMDITDTKVKIDSWHPDIHYFYKNFLDDPC